MTTDKTISSYFNPCSAAHDAMTNFKGLSCLKQMGIGAVVTLLAISILFAPFAVPVFRVLNERCQVQMNLDSTSQKVQGVYKKIEDFPPATDLQTLDDKTLYTIKKDAIVAALKGARLLHDDQIEPFAGVLSQPLSGYTIRFALCGMVHHFRDDQSPSYHKEVAIRIENLLVQCAKSS